MTRFQTAGYSAKTKPALHDHGWAAVFAAVDASKHTEVTHQAAAGWDAALKSAQK